MLGVVGLVGEARKQKHAVTDEGEAVAETRAWSVAGDGRRGAKLLPFPFCGLKYGRRLSGSRKKRGEFLT